MDTFNQGGGGQANLFQSPAVPSVKPAIAANAKFFIPTPALTNEQMMEAIAENAQEEKGTSNNPTTSNANEFYESASTIQKFPSVDNIAGQGITITANGFPPHSRRTASWSNFGNVVIPSMAEIGQLGEATGMSPSSFMPGKRNGSFGDELHEVEL